MIKDAIVDHMLPGGPAFNAGIQRGERITAVDGQAVSRAEILDAILANDIPGSTVVLTLESEDRGSRDVSVIRASIASVAPLSRTFELLASLKQPGPWISADVTSTVSEQIVDSLQDALYLRAEEDRERRLEEDRLRADSVSLVRVREELAMRDAQLQALEGRLAEREAEATGLRVELERAGALAAQRAREAEAAVRNAGRMQEELSALWKDNASLRKELDGLREEVAGLEDSLSDALRQNLRLQHAGGGGGAALAQQSAPPAKVPPPAGDATAVAPAPAAAAAPPQLEAALLEAAQLRRAMDDMVPRCVYEALLKETKKCSDGGHTPRLEGCDD